MLLRCPSAALAVHHPRRDYSFSSGFRVAETKVKVLAFPMEQMRRTKGNMQSSSTLRLSNPVFCSQTSNTDINDSSSRHDALSVHGVSDTIVGILGGGQLGRMLCQAASQMGIKVLILDPLENCPASALAYHHVVGSFNDSATVQDFAKRCGVLTVEIEHVDVATIEKLEQQGVDCQPKASTIQIIQDKYLQKVHFLQHDIPLPDFIEVNDFESTKKAGDLFGYPLMIKSKRLAYDGRGNAVAHSEKEIASSVVGRLHCVRKLTFLLLSHQCFFSPPIKGGVIATMVSSTFSL